MHVVPRPAEPPLLVTRRDALRLIWRAVAILRAALSDMLDVFALGLLPLAV